MKHATSAAKSAPKSAPKPASKRAARKPARATKVAAPRAPHGPGAPRPRWVSAAMLVASDDSPLRIPYDVFLDEARGVAGFVRKRWRPEGELPGLERVRNRLPEATPDEIAELIEAVQVAHTEATLAAAPAAPGDKARAIELVDLLAGALDFTLGDGDPEGDDARRLAKVRDFHADAGTNPAALGQDLRNHAALADAVRARLTHDDAGFDPAAIDEALALASRLTRPSLAPEAAADAAPGTSPGAPTPGGLALRNRLLTLLADRVALVRRCARHVFGAHPDVLMEATSAHERERRALSRKARAGAAPSPDAPPDPPPGAPKG
ncbi:MAG: hypothetical protein U0324_14885 [Polyangiales bacterium]